MCAARVKETGAVVTNSVCDNPPVNLSMLRSLGGKVDSSDTQPNLFLQNAIGNYVLAFMDPPHLIKLTRNTLGDKKELVDRYGRRVRWEHIVLLHKLQKKQGLHLANKLTQRHIDFSKNRMNVRYASQVLKIILIV